MNYHYLGLLSGIILLGVGVYYTQDADSMFQETTAQETITITPTQTHQSIWKLDSELAQYQSSLSGGQDVRYELTQAGKDLITTARNNHTVPALIPPQRRSEALCAGYLYELTARIRGPTVPYRIGMMNPQTKTAASARELPYSYRRYGGTTPIEIDQSIGNTIKDNPLSYPDMVASSWIEEFFIAAFAPESFFGDIGFLYSETNSLHELGTYNNYNSHVGKNFGLSRFTLDNIQTLDRTAQILKDKLSCSDEMWLHVRNLLKHYTRYLNDTKVSVQEKGNELVFVSTSGTILTPHSGDKISYDDLAIVHFSKGAHVSSLLEMSCGGVFYPINVLQINPKFLEIL